MKRLPEEEALRWFTQAKKLDKYYIPTRYPNGLPGGVPSRFFDDPKEAEEAMFLVRSVVELVERKIEAWKEDKR